MTAGGADQPELVTIAEITRTHGVKGELFARLLTDFPDRFAALDQVYLLARGGERRAFAILNCRLHKGGVIFQFETIDSRRSAEAWIGSLVQIPESQAVALPEDSYYHYQLQDAEAEDEQGQLLGKVVDVLHHSSQALLVVRMAEGDEVLVPLAGEYVRQIDAQRKKLVLRIPPDLRDLNR